MDERRTSYRVPADGTMTATIAVEDDAFSGTVVDTSDGGVGVAFPPDEAPAFKVGMGGLEVTLRGGPLPEPVTLAASVRSRMDGELTTYGLGFRDTRQVERLLPPESRAAFNRRREPRIPAPESPAWITVTAMEGPARGKRAVGTLLDVSSGGLGMALDLTTEDLLAESPTITCTFPAPGRGQERIRAGRIVNRTLHGPQIRYGVAFVEPDGTGPQQEAYEAAWDCVVCSTRLLLAQSHVHCPGCGTARGHTPTYFPEWEEAELNTQHWAWGEERPCPFCDVTFSDLATFCGRCGRPLA